MSSDDWTVVTADDKKRVMRKRGRRRRVDIDDAAASDRRSSAGGWITNGEALQEALKECVGYLISTHLYREFLNSLDRALEEMGNKNDDPRLGSLVCYGLGNFSRTTLTYFAAPLWQLAFALCVRKSRFVGPRYKGKYTYYDPCTTGEEHDFLFDRYDFECLHDNKRGNLVVGRKPCLVFMPHCPSRLYENVLWGNWESLVEPSAILIVGNSLHALADTLSGSRPDCPCIRALLPWLQEIELTMTKKDVDEATGNLEGAFNDTYLSYFVVPKEEKEHWVDRRPYDTMLENKDDPELL